MESMKLEKVIGLSSKGQEAIEVNPVTGDLVYIAGSFLVIYSPQQSKQTMHLCSRTSRPFQCCQFSKDGKYLAAGESAFRQPQITIWEINYVEVEENSTKVVVVKPEQIQPQDQKVYVKRAADYTPIKQLKGHKYGIECIKFSPDSEFLISIGDPNDRGLFVWDWRAEKKISSNKLSKPALTLAISDEQDLFVTGGYQHLKYWYLNPETGKPITVKPANSKDSIMESKTADLSKVKQAIFVGVAIYNQKVFALGADGHIYVYDKTRKLIKWMNIKVSRSFGLQASNDRLYCACSDGIVRIFATDTL
jgi:WD40 repeat protein